MAINFVFTSKTSRHENDKKAHFPFLKFPNPPSPPPNKKEKKKQFQQVTETMS